MGRSRSKKLTIGFFGSGDTSKKNIGALLDDATDGKDVVFILPATKDNFTDAIAAVADYADEAKIDFEVVTDSTTSKNKELKGLAADAAKSHKASGAVEETIINLLKEEDDGRLFIFWDKEAAEADDTPEEDVNAVEIADEEDVPAFDMCAGLDPIILDEEDQGQDEHDGSDAGDDADDGDDDEKPARRSRRSRSDDDEENDDSEGIPDEDTLNDLGLVELKKLAVRVLKMSEDDLKGKRKTTMVKLLLENAPAAGDGDGDDADESEEGQASREVANAMLEAQHALEAIPEHIALTPATMAALEAAATAFVQTLVIAIVTETRKPKSAGRPRKDGTEAAPVPEEVKNAPRRPRGRPRREEDAEAEREPESRTRKSSTRRRRSS